MKDSAQPHKSSSVFEIAALFPDRKVERSDLGESKHSVMCCNQSSISLTQHRITDVLKLKTLKSDVKF